MSTPPQAVLWDLDGVLVDSTRCHFEAFRALLRERGRELTEQEFASVFGLRNDAILRRLLGDLDRVEVEQLAQRKETLFRERVRGRVKPLPGALPLVHALQERGIAQAIVSSTPRENIELILRELGLTAAFAAVVGEEDSERGKPDPEPFLVAARRLGVPPSACVVIEDAPEGLAGAKAAGMRTIAVATTRPIERLRAISPDLLVSTLEDAAVRRFLFGDHRAAGR